MNLPAGLLDHNYEFFADAGRSHAFCLNSGRVLAFDKFPVALTLLLDAHFSLFPDKVKAAIDLASENGISALEQLTICNYGGFDSEPDMINGKLQSHEFWQCPKRGTCAYEGKCCDKLSTPSGEFLTPAEIRVVKLTAEGNLDKTIADRLSISTNTVAIHQRNIRRKTMLFRKADVTRFAHAKNLI